MFETTRKPISAILSRWRSNPDIGANIVSWETDPARPAIMVPYPFDLHPDLKEALRQRGIETLYSHQNLAWIEAQAGRNVVVVTGTASGKTLCYNLPVVDRILRDPQARALYLFPTKALAHDQADALRQLVASFESGAVPVAVYDGDTSTGSRNAIRSQGRVILSNPDMLHTKILPHHTLWAEFFRNLQIVVIDELHVYRGIFGSHVANVLRRLRRIARFYGAEPQYILTSATIANPVELAERLVERPVSLVDVDGSARGARHFLIYNPPVVDPDLGIRRSSLLEGVRLSGDLIRYGAQTIVFGRSRRSVELILNYLRQDQPEIADHVRGYRSGYLPRERRAIEQGLRSGQVTAVVATNALELGIDIGGMSAAILVGYPGTIAATRQQSGRAGRTAEASLSVLVASADALDQFLAHHPDYLTGRAPEHALVNPDNLLILLQHLRCAAFELPFRSGDRYGNLSIELVQSFLQILADSGELHFRGDRFFWMADQYPATAVSLRSASPENVLLQLDQEGTLVTIGQVDTPSAPWLAHPGAVYLHDSQMYEVEELDLERKTARLHTSNSDFYTEPQTQVTVQKISVASQAGATGCEKFYGELQVTSQLTGYRKVRWYTHEHLGYGEVSLPPSTLQTTGYWLVIADDTVKRLEERGLWTNAPNDYGPDWPVIRDLVRARDGYRCQICGTLENGRQHHVHHKTPFRTFDSFERANQTDNLITLCPNCHRKAELNVRMRSGLAGAAYAFGQLAPFFLMCDSRDLGVHSDPQASLGDGRSAIVVYDLVPAGIGLSERLFELHGELVARAFELVSTCVCTDGCPSCIGPAGENGMGGKRETLALLQELCG